MGRRRCAGGWLARWGEVRRGKADLVWEPKIPGLQRYDHFEGVNAIVNAAMPSASGHRLKLPLCQTVPPPSAMLCRDLQFSCLRHWGGSGMSYTRDREARRLTDSKDGWMEKLTKFSQIRKSRRVSLPLSARMDENLFMTLSIIYRFFIDCTTSIHCDGLHWFFHKNFMNFEELMTQKKRKKKPSTRDHIQQLKMQIHARNTPDWHIDNKQIAKEKIIKLAHFV